MEANKKGETCWQDSFSVSELPEGQSFSTWAHLEAEPGSMACPATHRALQ